MLPITDQQMDSSSKIESGASTFRNQYNFLRLAPSSDVSSAIPPDVALNVNQFLLLVGPQHWGMSFTQRLLNMHPYAVICDSADLKKFQTGFYGDDESKKSLVDNIYGLTSYSFY